MVCVFYVLSGSFTVAPTETSASCIVKIYENHHPDINHTCRYDGQQSMNPAITIFKRIFPNWLLSQSGNKSGITKLVSALNNDKYRGKRKLEKKQREDARRELNKLYDSIEVVFFSVDMIAQKVIEISSSCEKLYGYPSRDFLANYLLCFEVVHPDDMHILTGTQHIFENKELCGKQITNQFRIIRKDRAIRWVEAKMVTTFDKAGRFIRVEGMASDITDRKLAEQELQQLNQRLQLATRSAKVGIWDLNLLNNDLFWDEQMYLLYGTHTTEFADAHAAFDARLDPNDLARARAEVNMAISGEKPFDTEFKVIWPDNTIHYVKANAAVYRDESGKAFRMIGTNWDITESRRAEKALSLAQFTVDNATHAIFWIKPDGSFYNLNSAAHQMLGYTYNELMKLSIPQIDPFYTIKLWPIHWEDLRHKKSITLFTKQRRKDGVLIDVQVNAHYFMFDNMEMNCAFIYDITEHRANEELLKRSEAHLEIKNRELAQINKELEQFAYVASHDMQEPLRNTSNFVELLQRECEGKLTGNAVKYLALIVQSSDWMRVLIKDLLDYSRIGRQKEWEQVDCNKVLEQAIADLAIPVNQAGVEINHDHLPVISGYPTELHQLFQNLIGNAIKFRKKDKPQRIEISVREEKDHWEFAVTDHGIGIEKIHSERIFVIFQRLHTRQEYDGSGIGLAHCKKIVGLHGGKIWVDSIPGKKTTFYFTVRKDSN